MSSKRETELKFSLTAAEHQRLSSSVGGRTLLFTNTFFDTKDFALRKAGIGCRIRSIPGRRSILTVKFGGSYRKGVHVRGEIESFVEEKRANRIVSGRVPLASLSRTAPLRKLKRLIGAEAIGNLKRLGSLSTARTTFPLDSLKGELDACRLKSKRFFELEVESSRPERARNLAAALLRAHRIPLRPEKRSKLSRFFASL